MSKESINSIITWVGGKKALRPIIAKHIPDDIKSYIEPFGGAGWVLFYKERWANVEVYNDINGDLINLFRVAKYHPDALIDEMDLLPASRELFAQIIDNQGLTCIQRAARFMYLVHRSFGAMQKYYGTGKMKNPSSLDTLLMKVRLVSHRLDKVHLEHKHYTKLIPLYDHQDAFFFCDPPYFHGYSYGIDFDHAELFNVLKDVKGRWLLTYDDCNQVRDLYGDYEIIPVTRQKGINRKHGDMLYKEVIVKNY